MASIYLHIPFCERICYYCDFPKRVSKSIEIDRYLNALEKEIYMYPISEVIDTLYIGGGTPSILNISQIKRLGKILKQFSFSENLEFTLECNPEHITEEKITLFKQLGVNRISLGVQTFNDKLLKFLNRNHTKELVYNVVELLKKHNLMNINIDLIYSIPTQTIDLLKEDLENIENLDVNHISYYSLILEEKTVFERMLSLNKIQLIDNEIEAKMYEMIMQVLKDMGYNHYEISNYAKDGFQSRHNNTYWNNQYYYGFGMGASGYLNQVRYYNVNHVNEYIKLINDEKKPIKHQDLIDNNEALKEAFLLGLRLIDGLSIEELNNRYDVDVLKHFEKELEYLENKGWVKITSHIQLTETGLFYGNEVFQEFI